MSWLESLHRLRAAAPVVRYPAAAALVFLAVGAAVVAEAHVAQPASAPLFAAVILIAWFFGFGPAVLAAALGGAVLRYVAGQTGRWQLDGRDAGWLLLFGVTVLATAWLASTVRRLEDERRYLLARERAARADAEEASRIKDQVVMFVSHELKTPLTAILNWLHLLRTDKVRAEQIPTVLETIERNTRLQAKLVGDLLDDARAVRGKEIDLAMREVDVPDVVRHVIESHQPEAKAGGITLANHPDDGATVLGDPERLQQVVSNLVSNAMRFTPAGGQVNVAVTTDNRVARIVVHDTGEGIDGTVLPYIFEAFRQGERAQRRSDGLGLGLAITKHIVEMHGGTIRAESPGANRGETFIVELPRVA